MEGCISVRRKGNVWKDYIERIMNEENDWHCNIGDAVEGPVVCVSIEEVLQASKNENRKNPWTFRIIIGVECYSGE